MPAAEGKHRFWRNTTVASSGARRHGDAASRHAGLRMGRGPRQRLPSGGPDAAVTTTVQRQSTSSQDYGSTYAPGTATHALTLYRHTSGALVFGAGTVQWSWGLDSNHDRGSAAD